MCEKFRENLSTSFRENGVLKFWGGSEFRVHPLRGSPDPNCLLHFVTLGKAKNINLEWGESPPPHLGKILGFENFESCQLWAQIARITKISHLQKNRLE